MVPFFEPSLIVIRTFFQALGAMYVISAILKRILNLNSGFFGSEVNLSRLKYDDNNVESLC